MFKMNWVKEKEKLIIFKAKHNLPLTLNAMDIIPMTSKVWDTSFAVPDLVIKAMVDRGWNPLNFALLTNKKNLNKESKIKTRTINDQHWKSDGGGYKFVDRYSQFAHSHCETKG